jgi:hypothetical protein
MSTEEFAKQGEWAAVGDIGRCAVTRCGARATNYVLIKDKVGVWHFCEYHFMNYLRERDSIREKERTQ